MILWNKFFIFQVEFSFRAPAIRLRAQPVRPAPTPRAPSRQTTRIPGARRAK